VFRSRSKEYRQSEYVWKKGGEVCLRGELRECSVIANMGHGRTMRSFDPVLVEKAALENLKFLRLVAVMESQRKLSVRVNKPTSTNRHAAELKWCAVVP
jgi:hypothetical protein